MSLKSKYLRFRETIAKFLALVTPEPSFLLFLPSPQLSTKPKALPLIAWISIW